MLESWLLMLAAAASQPRPAAADSAQAPPPVELLEFVGDWSEEESRLIDDVQPAEEARRRENRTEASDDTEPQTKKSEP